MSLILWYYHCSSDSIPSVGTSICHRCSIQKKKKKKGTGNNVYDRIKLRFSIVIIKQEKMQVDFLNLINYTLIIHVFVCLCAY